MSTEQAASSDETEPPRMLVVRAESAPGSSNDSGGTEMLPFVIVAAVAGGLAKFVSATAALVGLAGSVGVLVLLRKPREGHFVLRLDEGALVVTRERRREPIARMTLEELADVTIDRKSTSTSRGGPSAERARLAFERSPPHEPIFVPDERVTSLEAQEWLARVRVFLRKHGWKPADERESSSRN